MFVLHLHRRRQPARTFEDRPVTGQRELSAVVGWRHPDDLGKMPVNAGDGMKPNILRDVKDGLFRCTQQHGGMRDANAIQVFEWSETHNGAEQPPKMCRAQFTHFRELIHRKIEHVVRADIVQRRCDGKRIFTVSDFSAAFLLNVNV